MTKNQTNDPETTGLAMVLGALILATALKAIWALNSSGSGDAILFCVYGHELQTSSLARLYQEAPLFNHTPFTAGLIRVLFAAAQRADPTPAGEFELFTAGLRFLSIFADIGLVAALLALRRRLGSPPWWALVAFAASPVSIMVSGFHGNIDPIMVLLVFLSALALYRGRPGCCGIFFGAAFNIKIVPLLLGPVFLFYWLGRDRGAAFRFAAAAGSLMLAGMAWPLVTCPAAFIHNVFGYGSYWGIWGVTYWLKLTGAADFQKVSFEGLSPAQNAVMLTLKAALIGSLLLLAWRRRKVPAKDFFTTLAAAFTLLFVFAPGAGVQYMVWFAPFILLVEPTWWAALTAGSTVFLVTFYHAKANFHFPWRIGFPEDPDVSFWAPWTNLVWGPLVALLALKGREWFLFKPKCGDGLGAVEETAETSLQR
jgi:uncharacterized membrane protein